MTERSHSGAGDRSPAEDLLHAALDALADGGPARLEELLAAHPEHARTVRERLERLRALGLVGDGASSAPAAVPERLGGFRLIERRGEGGMGLVWVAEEIALGRKVALKMVRPEQLWFAGARERFRREVAAVARLQHPGIVPVYAAGEEGGVPYFTMELVDGCTLADVLAELRGRDPRALTGADVARAVAARSPRHAERSAPAQHALPATGWIDACLQIVRQVAEALDYAHGRGVIHRDVKPSNVAITRSGRAMLLDFGLARSDTADRLTRTGSQPGSLPYMSPEQVSGSADLDARTDVYSLGAVLYELLTLSPAFGDEAATALQARIATGRFERPRARVPSIPWDVETVCLKAMEREPGRRYASADELARDLSNLLARRPIEARRAGALLRAVRWSQRNPKTSAALLAALPLALVALAWTAWNQSERRTEAERLTLLANEQAAIATAEKREVLRLSDVRRVQDLLRDEARLWPSDPERVAEHVTWLARASDVAGRLDLHRERLEELRATSGAAPGADGSWRFATTEIQWQYDTLADLVRAVESMLDPEWGRIAMVRRRHEFARAVEERSVSGETARASWAECRAVIADCARSPEYGGLELRPQIGLLPIGRDPWSRLWEFAHLQSGEPPRRGANGRLELRPETGLVFVLIPGGEFRMGSVREPGSEDYDPMAEPNETPAHEVELAPFFLSKYVMTDAQWERLVAIVPDHPLDAKGAMPHGPEPLLPMTCISWDDAAALFARLGCTLPTEAQWEYAARAGTRTPWWTGAEKESLRGTVNLSDRRSAGIALGGHEEWQDDGYVFTSPVDAMAPNPFGLHDMGGNVMQWCRDTFEDYTQPVRAGDGERAGTVRTDRTLRGGACVLRATHVRPALRIVQQPTYNSWICGARPARRLDP